MSQSDLERVLGALRPPLDVSLNPEGGSTVTGLFAPEAEHRGNPGYLFGGFSASILDHVCARAAAAVLGGPVLTGTLDLRFPAPVPIEGGPYELLGSAEPRRGKLTRARAVIQTRDGRKLVQAKGLFVLRDAT